MIPKHALIKGLFVIGALGNEGLGLKWGTLQATRECFLSPHAQPPLAPAGPVAPMSHPPASPGGWWQGQSQGQDDGLKPHGCWGQPSLASQQDLPDQPPSSALPDCQAPGLRSCRAWSKPSQDAPCLSLSLFSSTEFQVAP